MIPVQFIAPLLYGYEYWQLEADNNILAKIGRGRAAYLQWCVVATIISNSKSTVAHACFYSFDNLCCRNL